MASLTEAKSPTSPYRVKGEKKQTLTPSPKSPSKSKILDKPLEIGNRVTISGVKTGTLYYIGPTHFADGDWCGIELDDNEGKHDGIVGETRYFTCKPSHGIFAPSHKVEHLVVKETKVTSPKKSPKRSGVLSPKKIGPSSPVKSGKISPGYKREASPVSPEKSSKLSQFKSSGLPQPKKSRNHSPYVEDLSLNKSHIAKDTVDGGENCTSDVTSEKQTKTIKPKSRLIKPKTSTKPLVKEELIPESSQDSSSGAEKEVTNKSASQGEPRKTLLEKGKAERPTRLSKLPLHHATKAVHSNIAKKTYHSLNKSAKSSQSGEKENKKDGTFCIESGKKDGTFCIETSENSEVFDSDDFPSVTTPSRVDTQTALTLAYDLDESDECKPIDLTFSVSQKEKVVNTTFDAMDLIAKEVSVVFGEIEAGENRDVEDVMAASQISIASSLGILDESVLCKTSLIGEDFDSILRQKETSSLDDSLETKESSDPCEKDIDREISGIVTPEQEMSASTISDNSLDASSQISPILVDDITPQKKGLKLVTSTPSVHPKRIAPSCKRPVSPETGIMSGEKLATPDTPDSLEEEDIVPGSNRNSMHHTQDSLENSPDEDYAKSLDPKKESADHKQEANKKSYLREKKSPRHTLSDEEFPQPKRSSADYDDVDVVTNMKNSVELAKTAVAQYADLVKGAERDMAIQKAKELENAQKRKSGVEQIEESTESEDEEDDAEDEEESESEEDQEQLEAKIPQMPDYDVPMSDEEHDQLMSDLQAGHKKCERPVSIVSTCSADTGIVMDYPGQKDPKDRPVSMISSCSADTGYQPETDSEIGTLTANSPLESPESKLPPLPLSPLLSKNNLNEKNSEIFQKYKTALESTANTLQMDSTQSEPDESNNDSVTLGTGPIIEELVMHQTDSNKETIEVMDGPTCPDTNQGSDDSSTEDITLKSQTSPTHEPLQDIVEDMDVDLSEVSPPVGVPPPVKDEVQGAELPSPMIPKSPYNIGQVMEVISINCGEVTVDTVGEVEVEDQSTYKDISIDEEALQISAKQTEIPNGDITDDVDSSRVVQVKLSPTFTAPQQCGIVENGHTQDVQQKMEMDPEPLDKEVVPDKEEVTGQEKEAAPTKGKVLGGKKTKEEFKTPRPVQKKTLKEKAEEKTPIGKSPRSLGLGTRRTSLASKKTETKTELKKSNAQPNDRRMSLNKSKDVDTESNASTKVSTRQKTITKPTDKKAATATNKPTGNSRKGSIPMLDLNASNRSTSSVKSVISSNDNRATSRRLSVTKPSITKTSPGKTEGDLSKSNTQKSTLEAKRRLSTANTTKLHPPTQSKLKPVVSKTLAKTTPRSGISTPRSSNGQDSLRSSASDISNLDSSRSGATARGRPGTRSSTIAKPKNRQAAGLKHERSSSAGSDSQLSTSSTVSKASAAKKTRESTPDLAKERLAAKRKSLIETSTTKLLKKTEPRRASVAVTGKTLGRTPVAKKETTASGLVTPAAKKTATNQNRNKTTGQSLAKGNNQPDLVSNSVSANNAAKEITRLEALCEKRTKELQSAKIQLKAGIEGFDAMGVLVRYLTEEMNAFSCPEITARLQDTKSQLVTAQQQLEVLAKEKETLEEDIKTLKAEHMAQTGQLKTEHQQNLKTLRNNLEQEKEEEVQAVIDRHSHEVTTLKSYHERNLSDTRKECDTKITEKEKENEKILEQQRKEYEAKMSDLQQQHETKLNEITMRFENIKLTLSEKVEFLRNECEEMRLREKTYMEQCARDAELKVQRAVAQFSQLPQELDSMKAVLDLKNDEIHELRKQKLELSRQLESLPPARERIRGLEQKVENLEAIISMKGDYERQLTEKHSLLLKRLEKESKANKRLSMDNEELSWRLSDCSSPDVFRRQISRSPTNSESGSDSCKKKSPNITIRNGGGGGGGGGDFNFDRSPRSPRSPSSASSSLKRSGTYDLLNREFSEADMMN